MPEARDPDERGQPPAAVSACGAIATPLLVGDEHRRKLIDPKRSFGRNAVQGSSEHVPMGRKKALFHES